MIEFIIGRAGSGKSYTALTEIAKKIKNEPLGAPILLLLPEHMTYKMERELLDITGSGFFRAEVLGFRRFARSVLLKVGGLNVPRITDVGRNLLLKNILRKNQNKLSFFARAAKKRGFSKVLSDAIQEVKTYQLTVDDLKEASKTVNDETLSAKLQDLSLLAEEFQNSMEGRYNDNEDIFEELIRRLPEANFLDGMEVWVDGFIFFNPEEREIIRGLMQKACVMHITLAMDPNLNSIENVKEIGIFNRAYKTMLSLKKMAKELEQDAIITRLDKNFRAKTPALIALEKGLFSRANITEKNSDGIALLEAGNMRLEVETIISDIIRLAREENYRYSDIGVLVRDESYNALIRRAFTEADVPFFSDSKRSAATHPLAELIRSSLEAISTFSYESIFRTLRTGFFAIPREALDSLENYCIAFNIRGEKRWRMEEDWDYRKKSLDFDEEMTEGEEKFLEEINFFRRECIKHVLTLKDLINSGKTVAERTKALYEFLTMENVPQTLEEWTKIAESEGKLDAALLHQKVWKDIMGLFDQLVEISGDEKIGLKSYTELLEEGLVSLEMSIIPPGLDGVTVASFNQNSLFNFKAIYILGANSGIMPHYIQESGFFTDAERLKIKDCGKEIASGSKDGNLAENYLLYRAFNEMSERLFVSYALSDGMGNPLAPAHLVARLKQILPKLKTKTEILSDDKLRYFYPKKALSDLVLALRLKKEGAEIEEWWADIYNFLSENVELKSKKNLIMSALFKTGKTPNLSFELTKNLFTKNSKLTGSVTRFESFNSCPFKHFANYGLRLKEPEVFDFHAFDLGSLLHSSLRAFGENLKLNNRRWADISEEEAEEILNKILEEIVERLRGNILLSSAQYIHQKNRIELLAKRSINRLITLDKVSKFHPALYEASFGNGKRNPLSYKLNKNIRLEILGQIDRMDFSSDGKYFLIIDYKTGNAAINLLEVYYGLKMQLLTYLLAAKNFMENDEKNRIPAGMLYFFLRYPMLTQKHPMDKESVKAEIEKQLKMPGWVLADEDVISSIDETLKFLKIRLTQKGIHASDKANVKTQEEFDILLNYMDFYLEYTGREILTGNINPAPYKLKDKTPCAYCPYDIVCDFDPQIEGFLYRELKDKPDDEIYEKMKEANKKNGVDE